MNADKHPEYQKEKTHLDQTIATIDERIRKVGGMSGTAADPYTQDQVRSILRRSIDALRSVRPSPYFGRIDFQENGSDCANVYIGKEEIHDGTFKSIVHDWRSSIASLFYSRMTTDAEYDSPDGLVRGTVFLRRNFEIVNCQLRTIADEYDQRPIRLRDATLVDPDEYLSEILSRSSNAVLKDIVATIQAQQDALIRAPYSQILLIQGVAGSGKTSIALHRLAFLLYPGNKTGIEADRVIIFGPNRLFLRYVGSVLPGLNIERIRQTTFEDWALEQMNLANYQIDDGYLEQIFAPSSSDLQDTYRRRTRLKGSLKIAQVLSRYVDIKRKMFNPPEIGFEYASIGPLEIDLRVSRQEILRIFNESQNSPFRIHQQRVIDGVVEVLRRQYHKEVAGYKIGEPDPVLKNRADEIAAHVKIIESFSAELPSEPEKMQAEGANLAGDREIIDNLQRGALGLEQLAARLHYESTTSSERRKELQAKAKDPGAFEKTMKSLRDRVQKDVLTLWPSMSLHTDYYKLFTTDSLLRQVAEGLLSNEEISALIESSGPSKEHVKADDTAPLYIFNILLNGTPRVRYDHMIVDEAQDLSPLQFQILREHATARSITILGDISQGIYSHRSVSSWDEVRDMYNDAPSQYEEITRSYRSTYEITAFANDVLQKMPGDVKILAVPFDRHGPKPTMTQSRNYEEMVMAIAETMQKSQADGFKTIALICKTIHQCQDLATALTKRGIENLGVVDSADYDYRGGLVAIPTYFAKGLEFDIVLVANADEKTFPATEEDARLLYVSVTRPLHRLHIFWEGKMSPLLPPPAAS